MDVFDWRVSSSLATDFVFDTLEKAIDDRCCATPTGLDHHSVGSTQYLSIGYTDRLAEAGIATIGRQPRRFVRQGLAESIIGLFKTAVIQRRGPWRHAGPSNLPTCVGTSVESRPIA